MEYYKESILTDYPNVISYSCTKKITEQMEKNICKINIEKNQGTGFFCKIPFPNQNKMLPVLITNNHIINQDILYKENVKIELDIKAEEKIKEITLNNNRMKYTNEKYDITIIEIKSEDKIDNYLELDDIIIDDILNNINKNKEYINQTIYIIQYPENELSVSYGILDAIYEDKKYNLNHKCSTKGGSSGSPILKLNNKVIGIHKEGAKKFNKGTLLNFPIKDFIQLNNKNNEKEETLLKEEFKKLNVQEISNNNIGNPINQITVNKSIKMEFKVPPLIGLKNVGAQCFMNATLQCLLQIESLVNYFKYQEKLVVKKKFKGQIFLAKSFKILIENLWPTNGNKHLVKNS